MASHGPVCIGEFVASDDADAYRCVNSKRADLLLMDESCTARHALEYQGAGHHQGTAAARDGVKKEALRKAGIGYHEVGAGHTTPTELKRLVEKLVPELSLPRAETSCSRQLERSDRSDRVAVNGSPPVSFRARTGGPASFWVRRARRLQALRQ